MKEGWICPKCGKVLAPWVPACDCYKQYKNEQTIQPRVVGHVKIWDLDSVEECFDEHKDTGGNYHFTGVHTGHHVIRKDGE